MKNVIKYNWEDSIVANQVRVQNLIDKNKKVSVEFKTFTTRVENDEQCEKLFRLIEMCERNINTLEKCKSMRIETKAQLLINVVTEYCSMKKYNFNPIV